MLKRLSNYYRSEGILSTDFRCKHLRECRGGADDFTEAKSAFVGDRYGIGVPRLLFVSLDPGSAKMQTTDGGEIDFSPEKNRTPESVRRLVLERVQRGVSGHHQRAKETGELARCILRAFHSGVDEMGEEELTRHFAHANSAKCCQNKNGREQADGKMFRRCRVYLRGEIAVFKPDILITHGGEAKKGIQFSLGKKRREKPGKEVAPNAFECRTADGGFFWLQTPHPSSYGRPKFLKQKRGEDGGPGWAGYVELIRAFMNERAGV